jgi:coenzyme PQQ synthesis protein D (PqqD)
MELWRTSFAMQNAMPTFLPQARSAQLLVQTMGDELVIYDRQSLRIRRLNRTAALVWEHCNGRRSVAELVTLARTKLAAPTLAQASVERALDRLADSGLLRDATTRSPRIAPPSRRTGSRRKVALAHAPVVASMLAPTPLMSVSLSLCGQGCTTSANCAGATDGCTTCSGGTCINAL